jgi:hypothetical protein
MRIKIAAIGCYAYAFSEDLKAALAESIRSHMEAYGVKDASVTVEAHASVPGRLMDVDLTDPKWPEKYDAFTNHSRRVGDAMLAASKATGDNGVF